MASFELSKFFEEGKKIVAVARNFRAHAAELGNVMPSKPLLFLKPTSSYLREGKPILIPRGCQQIHHEVELGVVIEKSGADITEEDAMNHVGGYVLALDMTARDFQSEAKKNGHPWMLAKGFDTSCPIGKFLPKNEIPNPHDVNLWLNVNGESQQNGSTNLMVFKIPTLISYISQYFTLEKGDLILTGTPDGVGPVKTGDIIEAGINDLDKIKFEVKSR